MIPSATALATGDAAQNEQVGVICSTKAFCTAPAVTSLAATLGPDGVCCSLSAGMSRVFLQILGPTWLSRLRYEQRDLRGRLRDNCRRLPLGASRASRHEMLAPVPACAPAHRLTRTRNCAAESV
jgi:hypothetical protein